MDYVSLLPPEIKQKRLEGKRQALIIRIAIISFIIIMALYAFLLVSTIMARSRLNTVRQELTALETQVEALREYEVLYNDMNRAEERVAQAMGTIPPWQDFLLDLGLTLPPGVWLSDMNVTYAAESGSMSMRGWGFSHAGVADMLGQVKTMDQLDNVNIGTSFTTTYEGRDAVQFNVEAKVLPGPPFVGEIEAEEEPQQEEEEN